MDRRAPRRQFGQINDGDPSVVVVLCEYLIANRKTHLPGEPYYNSTRSIAPLLMRLTNRSSQSLPSSRLAISTTM
jgi:hypothetical protein